MKLLTEQQLAEDFGITVDRLHELRQKHHWPCTRLGRFIYRFTSDQVAEILAIHAENPIRPTTPGPGLAAVAGQTKRSASRSRA